MGAKPFQQASGFRFQYQVFPGPYSETQQSCRSWDQCDLGKQKWERVNYTGCLVFFPHILDV